MPANPGPDLTSSVGPKITYLPEVTKVCRPFPLCPFLLCINVCMPVAQQYRNDAETISKRTNRRLFNIVSKSVFITGHEKKEEKGG